MATTVSFTTVGIAMAAARSQSQQQGNASFQSKAPSAQKKTIASLKISAMHGSMSQVTPLRERVASYRPLVGSLRSARLPITVVAGPPTVADTKREFLSRYARPIPNIYNTVIQELLVLHHIIRYNSTYVYDPVFALGFCTVYDQLMDGFGDKAVTDAIFSAYIGALNEDPSQYRQDASSLEAWAGEQSADSLFNFDGEVGGRLSGVAERAKDGKFHYSRFFAIGLFRILEVAKLANPDVLAKITEALNVPKQSVDRDLDTYRGLLNKLKSAKELLRDFLEREKKKQEERTTVKAPAPTESSTA